ncbi:nucleoside ABC transporter membrane protein [Clostridium amylolyticum]|uniref:Nucleoside ABC transporter membrane protein n=1 Tax=Clostridium amylolyticum TaxID=1121298 RepID=A0A1M6B010_9CLOT|nr:ABC transporter permease [Clostridium amylolyticum]SHI42046.1 nucleoside ABC transporter membrane protein [Clostridium amylolyticum]
MDIAAFLHAAVIAGTPLLLATLGEILTERSGNLNLGVEGMMLMGAAAGFLTGFYTKSATLAILGAALFGGFGALIYAFLTVSLKANQVVTGLTLTIFGTGISTMLGQKVVGEPVPDSIKAVFRPISIPILGKIPFIGEIIFNHDIIIYISFMLTIILGVYIYRTSLGLNLRAVGENPSSADAASINVPLYKYIHIVIGGMLCGLAGAYLSLVYVPAWQEGVTAGRGWIAVALVIFAGWNPYKAFIGAYLFGGLDILGLRLANPIISRYILDMLPYATTIVVLVISSIKKSKKGLSPEALGNAYFREER